MSYGSVVFLGNLLFIKLFSKVYKEPLDPPLLGVRS